MIKEKTCCPFTTELGLGIGVAPRRKHALKSRSALHSFAVTEKLATDSKTFIERAPQGLVAIGYVHTAQGPVSAMWVRGDSNRRRECHACPQLDTLMVGQIEIGLKSAQIGEPTPRARFGLIEALVFGAQFVVAANCPTQEEWGRKEVTQLDPI